MCLPSRKIDKKLLENYFKISVTIVLVKIITLFWFQIPSRGIYSHREEFYHQPDTNIQQSYMMM